MCGVQGSVVHKKDFHRESLTEVRAIVQPSLGQRDSSHLDAKVFCKVLRQSSPSASYGPSWNILFSNGQLPCFNILQKWIPMSRTVIPGSNLSFRAIRSIFSIAASSNVLAFFQYPVENWIMEPITVFISTSSKEGFLFRCTLSIGTSRNGKMYLTHSIALGNLLTSKFWRMEVKPSMEKFERVDALSILFNKGTSRESRKHLSKVFHLNPIIGDWLVESKRPPRRTCVESFRIQEFGIPWVWSIECYSHRRKDANYPFYDADWNAPKYPREYRTVSLNNETNQVSCTKSNRTTSQSTHLKSMLKLHRRPALISFWPGYDPRRIKLITI